MTSVSRGGIASHGLYGLPGRDLPCVPELGRDDVHEPGSAATAWPAATRWHDDRWCGSWRHSCNWDLTKAYVAEAGLTAATRRSRPGPPAHPGTAGNPVWRS